MAKTSKKQTNTGGSDLESVSERVAKRIRPASQLPQHARFLFYGRSGVGKTRLAASAPDVLLIDINEQGTTSVRRDYDPQVYPVETWTELQDVYWYLASGDHPYKSVALDGATAMQNLCMKFILGDEASRDASRDPDMPTRQAWGKLGELMKTQIVNYRNLPMNVIFTALQRSRVSGDGAADEEEMTIGPACSPSVAGTLEAAVDIIGYLVTREVILKKKETGKTRRVVRRKLMVGPSERFVTKDRTGRLPNDITDPDLEAMIKLIFSDE